MSQEGMGKASTEHNMTVEDIEICQRLDEEYERALEEREIGYNARFQSVRQSAFFSVFFMFAYLALGTLFFMRQTNWTIPESLLFSIYTVTTVGYGNQPIPNNPGFQAYTIFYILVGIAALTIMVAQVYQCIALEASRAQHGRDKTEMARRGLNVLAENSLNGADALGSLHGDASVDEIIAYHHQNLPGILDFLFRQFDRAKDFFRNNEFGRGISVIFPLAGLVGIGALVVGPVEGWTFLEACYFSVVSLTTVGFGDYVPTQTASIIFCIVWLPFSIGFMSIFLGNVASFYIQLSDKNIHRIESHMRRRLQRVKDVAERERAEVLKRAYRGQEQAVANATSKSSYDPSLNAADGPIDAMASVPLHHARIASQRRDDNFNVLQNDQDGSMHSAAATFGLFGSNGEVDSSQRRRRILENNVAVFGSDKKPRGRTMRSMKDVINVVRRNIQGAHDNPGNDPVAVAAVKNAGRDSEFMSIHSTTSTIPNSIAQRNATAKKPSFGLRVLVQERFADIIATDIAGYESSIEIEGTTLSVTIDVMMEAADKWLIPRRARKAFRAVAFEALYFVGEHGLVTKGADALFELSPFEFHGLFNPLLAAMGDAETMEGWLANTDVLSGVDLRRPIPAANESRDVNIPHRAVVEPSTDCSTEAVDTQTIKTPEDGSINA